MRALLGELLAGGSMEYAEGPDAGRRGGARCWRLRTAPTLRAPQGSWAIQGLAGARTLLLPRYPLPRRGEGGRAAAAAPGRTTPSVPWGLGAPEEDRPPPGFWRDTRTGKERRATEPDLRDANRLLAKPAMSHTGDGTTPTRRWSVSEPLLTARQVAELLGVSPRRCCAGRGAASCRRSSFRAARVRYRPDELEAWLDEQRDGGRRDRGVSATRRAARRRSSYGGYRSGR